MELEPDFGRLRPRAVLVRLALLVGAIVTAPLGIVWLTMVRMPGKSAPSALPPLTREEREAAERLRSTVDALGRLGEHNVAHPQALGDAAELVERAFSTVGLRVRRDPVEVHGVISSNLEAEHRGDARPDEILVVGAHYDSALGAPGANDNGSGVAALLELARSLGTTSVRRTIRFVAFTNEEPPYFRKAEQMGSRVYAAQAAQRGDRIVGMLSLETMGWFSDERGSQRYPFPLSLYYPDRGDFIAFVGSRDSAGFVRHVVGTFRAAATIPSEGAALPANLPGVGWSDHESFDQRGVPALMVTDTAPFRYPHYHTKNDTPDKLDYERLARVVVGLAPVVRALATE